MSRNNGCRRFNTTLVQLKVMIARAAIAPGAMFQYHTGPIKRSAAPRVTPGTSRFQYHTGPIKSGSPALMARNGTYLFQYHTGPIKRLLAAARQVPGVEGFNTTLVQLKDLEVLRGLQLPERFQYHTGPIKSQLDPTAQDHDPQFQYHTGPIKSLHRGRDRRDGRYQFQYHTGPIKRRMISSTWSCAMSFQYHTGPIKRQLLPEERPIFLRVSIPHWSN